MTSTPTSRFAETELGVHAVYAEAKRLQIQHQEVLSDLNQARMNKRKLEADLVEREMDIASDTAGANPEMSAAAMDRQLKVVRHKDEQCKKLRASIMHESNVIDALEGDVNAYKRSIDIEVARMHELGGYFQLLAAEKNTSPAPR